jgi:RNA polymerase sigma-70 factor (ECF subfamily)
MTVGSDLREAAGTDKDCKKTIQRMRPDSNLEALMARYQQGDFAAATDLIEGVSPQLHRFFAAQAVSRADADDLLQETWLRIHKVRHTYRPGEPALSWFYAIARHIRVDHHRKSIRTVVGERKLEANSQDAVAAPTDSDHAEGLEALLAPLPASQREVIEMLKVAGMSLDEVARATSSTVGSVKQKVHRAYKKLRETMSPGGFRKGPSGEIS